MHSMQAFGVRTRDVESSITSPGLSLRDMISDRALFPFIHGADSEKTASRPLYSERVSCPEVVDIWVLPVIGARRIGSPKNLSQSVVHTNTFIPFVVIEMCWCPDPVNTTLPRR